MKVRDDLVQEAKKKINEALEPLNSYERKQLLSNYYDTEASTQENLSMKSVEILGEKRGELSSLDEAQVKAEQVDGLLNKIANEESYEINEALPVINCVGEEGESIISFALKETDYKLIKKLLTLSVNQKEAMSGDVRETIQSVVTYTEIPMTETKELIGHFFIDNPDEFGIY